MASKTPIKVNAADLASLLAKANIEIRSILEAFKGEGIILPKPEELAGAVNTSCNTGCSPALVDIPAEIQA